MANLTLSIDDETLRRARVRAAQEGTSVNAVARAALSRYGGPNPSGVALTRFLALTSASVPPGTTGDAGIRRDEIYADRVER